MLQALTEASCTHLAGMLHLPVFPAFPQLCQAVSEIPPQSIFRCGTLGLQLPPPLHLQCLLLTHSTASWNIVLSPPIQLTLQWGCPCM